MRGWPSTDTDLATLTRSSTWPAWGAGRCLIPTVLGEPAWAKFSYLERLVDEITARPAAQRAVALREKVQVQNRDGRFGAPFAVSAPVGKGHLTFWAAIKTSPSARSPYSRRGATRRTLSPGRQRRLRCRAEQACRSPGRVAATRLAALLAPTATVAMAATVMAVPSPMTKVEATPAQYKPCANANTSTMIAPEQGRSPTATIAERPRRQPPGPANSSGSGPCAWPHGKTLPRPRRRGGLAHDHARGRGHDVSARRALHGRDDAVSTSDLTACKARKKPRPFTHNSRTPTRTISE